MKCTQVVAFVNGVPRLCELAYGHDGEHTFELPAPGATHWRRADPADPYCANCGRTFDMHIAGSNECPPRRDQP